MGSHSVLASCLVQAIVLHGKSQVCPTSIFSIQLKGFRGRSAAKAIAGPGVKWHQVTTLNEEDIICHFPSFSQVDKLIYESIPESALLVTRHQNSFKYVIWS